MRNTWTLALLFGLGACDGAAPADAGADVGSSVDCSSVDDGTPCGTQRICRRPFGCIESRCGDMFVDALAGEQCDDGNDAADDGCNPDCTLTCDVDGDCDDGNVCNGVERCNTASRVCEYGAAPSDHPVCTIGGAAGICRAGACAMRCDPTAPFTDIQPLTGINTDSSDDFARLSSDERTLYFSSNRITANAMDVYVATRSSRFASFTDSMRLPGVNTAGTDRGPSVTGDGLFLYAYAEVPNAVFVASRLATDDDFGPFESVPELTLDTEIEQEPYVLPSHSAIYFVSDRDGTNHLYRIPRSAAGVFGTAAPVSGTQLQTAEGESEPVVTPDELTLYFGSSRSGSASIDIWVATRASLADGFGPPVNAGDVNTADVDFPTWVSADACTLYYVSIQTDAVGTRHYDIFVANRTP